MSRGLTTAGDTVCSPSATGSSLQSQIGGRGRGAGLTAEVGGTLQSAWLFPFDVAFRVMGLRYGWLVALFRHAPPVLLEVLGKRRAERAAWRAIRRVPAYHRYITGQPGQPLEAPPLGILGSLPETDKHSYIDRYSLEDRCVGGQFPFAGTTLDESSGSTGRPYDWIRSERERSVAHRNIGFFARYILGDKPLVTINAFSMGAWAAGVNTAQGMNRHSLVKSTGPDMDKVFSTLRLLGPRYRYAICGYPPFLKHMIDVGDRAHFDWGAYELHGLVGGEGMAEELRDYLLGRFRSVYSGYGATDLEVGIAAETPVSVAIRRLARAHPEVRQALFGDHSRLPMVFQYDPLIHWLEVDADGQVVVTVSRLDLISPRIRYNVHDEGGVAPWRRMHSTLARFGFDLERLGDEPAAAGPGGVAPWEDSLPLPFLWIFGRSDSTISIMGANVYPEDVEASLYADSDSATGIRSFQLAVAHDESGTPRPAIHLELDEGVVVDDAWRAAWATRLRDRLASLSRDYRSSSEEFPDAMLPIVQTYALGTGPFEADAGRIKQRRITLT